MNFQTNKKQKNQRPARWRDRSSAALWIISVIFEVQEVEVGRGNRPKIDQKAQSKMECILVSIFFRRWCILEAKLDCRIHSNRSDLAWRPVMARRGEARRGEAVARRGEARRGQGVKGVAGRISRRLGGSRGFALL